MHTHGAERPEAVTFPPDMPGHEIAHGHIDLGMMTIAEKLRFHVLNADTILVGARKGVQSRGLEMYSTVFCGEQLSSSDRLCRVIDNLNPDKIDIKRLHRATRHLERD